MKILFHLTLLYFILYSLSYQVGDTYSYFSDESIQGGSIATSDNFCRDSTDYFNKHLDEACKDEVAKMCEDWPHLDNSLKKLIKEKCKDNSGLGNGCEDDTVDDPEDCKEPGTDPDNPAHGNNDNHPDKGNEKNKDNGPNDNEKQNNKDNQAKEESKSQNVDDKTEAPENDTDKPKEEEPKETPKKSEDESLNTEKPSQSIDGAEETQDQQVDKNNVTEKVPNKETIKPSTEGGEDSELEKSS
ncbi:hypothetical protein [Rossellomorea sp. KS-H15a]|uniref:hypothetical protein n=1 Tax=Rossellomorea sp. KS-H15a TaxID=2963940 RepID=UPI0020C62BCC|nr:hypothetical protein [Rossellomorea sp. KS-H15a]UTE77538.1 hypothetical protein M1J35_01590 [Rossellomorea sp. KS-H15a]